LVKSSEVLRGNLSLQLEKWMSKIFTWSVTLIFDIDKMIMMKQEAAEMWLCRKIKRIILTENTENGNGHAHNT